AEVYAATQQPKAKLLALASKLLALGGDVRAQAAAGIAFAAAGDEDAAQSAYRAALALAPTEHRREAEAAALAARQGLARLLNRRGARQLESDPEHALATLDEAQELLPGDAVT